MNPVWVIAEEDEHFGRRAGADTEARTEGGDVAVVSRREVPVVRRDFIGEGDPASGERPEGVFGGRGRRVEGARSEAGAPREERLIGEVLQGSRSAGDMFTTICFRVIIAVVRAFTAVSRAILSRRIISTAPSAVLGIAVDWPASNRAGGGLGVDGVGLAGGAAQAPVASIHFRDTMPGVANGPRQAGAHSCRCLRCRRPRSVRGCRPRQQAR